MPLSKIPGLVLHLPMNEQNGVVANDNSRYGNDGSLGGGDAAKMPVWAEHGLRFDGVNDYVDCGNDASLEISTYLTVSLWINPTSFTGSGGVYSHPIRYGNDNYTGYITSSGGINFLGKPGGAFGTISGAYTLPDLNRWYHIALVYNTTIGGQLYANGDPIGSLTNNGDLLTGGNLWVGRGSPADRYFNGSIDDVRIYNRALSAAEITDLYNERRYLYV